MEIRSNEVRKMVQENIGGYFRINEEEEFPWGMTNRIVWYALFIIKDGKMTREGFTPSKSNKINLSDRLGELIRDKVEHTLIGVWTGNYTTNLFILDSKKAIKKLREATK